MVQSRLLTFIFAFKSLGCGAAETIAPYSAFLVAKIEIAAPQKTLPALMAR
jgi:hypothetical protein